MQRIVLPHKNHNKQIRNCIACLLRPLLRMGSVCGISIMSAQCRYSGNPTRMEKFDKSYKLLILSLILFVPMLLGISESLTEMFNIKGNIKKVLGLLVEISFSFDAATTGIFGLLKREKE